MTTFLIRSWNANLCCMKKIFQTIVKFLSLWYFNGLWDQNRGKSSSEMFSEVHLIKGSAVNLRQERQSGCFMRLVRPFVEINGGILGWKLHKNDRLGERVPRTTSTKKNKLKHNKTEISSWLGGINQLNHDCNLRKGL